MDRTLIEIEIEKARTFIPRYEQAIIKESTSTFLNLRQIGTPTEVREAKRTYAEAAKAKEMVRQMGDCIAEVVPTIVMLLVINDKV